MPTSPGLALRVVRGAFEHTIEQMRRMHADCQVKPNDVNVIQASTTNGQLTLECGPVVCRVPERADLRGANLYIVSTGFITFQPEQRHDQLVTMTYGTNFAYFSVTDDHAAHVFGGHYDFSPAQAAHPRAHLQLASHANLYEHVQSHFHSLANTALDADYMQHVLHRVRPPSAQMDFLSFLLQICADHLVDERSPASVIGMFDGLARSCAPLFGYHLELEICGCHRGAHWYPPQN
jgi:hypothetical protein